MKGNKLILRSKIIHKKPIELVNAFMLRLDDSEFVNFKVIDLMRASLFPFNKMNILNGKLRILNIYNLAQKLNHRIYNLSLGKKVLLNELVKWLNYYNPKKPKINILKSSFNRDNFTLNNGKLLNKIKIKINLSELKKKCLELSKINFKYVK